jgi:hypothetical protein
MPFRIEPELIQVSENSSEGSKPGSMSDSALFSHTSRAGFHVAVGFGASTEEPPHVLDDDDLRAQHPDRVLEVGPQTGACAGTHPGAASGEAEVLAGEPATENVHRFHRRPVDLRHVTVVRDTRPPGGEHL